MRNYKIISEIDEGSYGKVWKAYHKQTNNLVAIKQIAENDSTDQSRKYISREIAMLHRLRSQYIVNLQEAFKKNGTIYLIFEYFDRNLLKLIKQNRFLTEQNIKQIFYKILKCVQFIHTKKIIHRDLKPQNILINKTNLEVKLCDLGFSRYAVPEDQLTKYISTRWYRAPQLILNKKYSYPSDMWSIGCIFYQLLTKQPLLPGNNEYHQLCLISQRIQKFGQEDRQNFKNLNKFQGLQFPIQHLINNFLEKKLEGIINIDGINLIKNCLKIVPTQRINIFEALSHSYFKSAHLQQYLQQFSITEQPIRTGISQILPKQKIKNQLTKCQSTQLHLQFQKSFSQKKTESINQAKSNFIIRNNKPHITLKMDSTIKNNNNYWSLQPKRNQRNFTSQQSRKKGHIELKNSTKKNLDYLKHNKTTKKSALQLFNLVSCPTQYHKILAKTYNSNQLTIAGTKTLINKKANDHIVF